MRVLVSIGNIPDRIIMADTPDEMFLEIAALHQELIAQRKAGVCTVSGFDYQSDKENYEALFAMGNPL